MGQQINTDPIFKGCTRPAMKAGVPLMPLIAVFIVCAMLCLWGGFFFGPPAVLTGITVFIVSLLTMRSVTKHDDQRLNQVLIWLRLRLRNVNRNFWGATSYSPTRYKKR